MIDPEQIIRTSFADRRNRIYTILTTLCPQDYFSIPNAIELGRWPHEQADRELKYWEEIASQYVSLQFAQNQYLSNAIAKQLNRLERKAFIRMLYGQVKQNTGWVDKALRWWFTNRVHLTKFETYGEIPGMNVKGIQLRYFKWLGKEKEIEMPFFGSLPQNKISSYSRYDDNTPHTKGWSTIKRYPPSFCGERKDISPLERVKQMSSFPGGIAKL